MPFRRAVTAINPPHMLDRDGKVRNVKGKPVCLICHSKKPDPAVDSTEDVKFKADVGFLCWRCHPPMPDPFFREHFLVKPSERTLREMKKTEEEQLVILPLVPRGRITCSTCHNPHQEGIILRASAAKGADARYGLRVQSMCLACHKI